MTFLEAAIEILKRERQPLHYKQLTEIALAKNLLTVVGRTPELTMQQRLNDALKKSDSTQMLTREKPGVYGLRYYPPPSATPAPAAAAPAPAATAPEAAASSGGEAAAADATGPGDDKKRRRRRGRGRHAEGGEAPGRPEGPVDAAAIARRGATAAARREPAEASDASDEPVATPAEQVDDDTLRRATVAEGEVREVTAGETVTTIIEAAPARAEAERSQAESAEATAADDHLLDEMEIDAPAGPLMAPGHGTEEIVRGEDHRPVYEGSGGGGGRHRRGRGDDRGRGPNRPGRPGERPQRPGGGDARHAEARPGEGRHGEHRTSEHRSSEHRSNERTGEGHRSSPSPGDFRPGDRTGPVEHRPSEHRASEHRASEHRASEHRASEHRASEHRTAEHRTAEHRTAEARPATEQRPADARPVEQRPVEARPGDARRSLVDTAFDVLRGGDGRPLHIRQLVDLAIKKRMLRGEPPELWRLTRVALLCEQRAREAAGLRPRIRSVGGGHYVLADRKLDNDLVQLERTVAADATRLTELSHAALGRRIARLPAPAFEALARMLLERMRIFDVELVKRGEGVAYFGGLATAGGKRIKLLIALRPGEAPIGHNAIAEVRGGLKARGFEEGLLISAGRASAEAHAELRAAAGAVALCDGEAFVKACAVEGLGVVRRALTVDLLDLELLGELAD